MAAFTVIDHEEATGNITSWSKDSIPSSYDHLLLVASTRGQKSAYFDYYKLWFNDDSVGGSNYSRTPLETKAGNDIRSVRQTGQGYLAMNGLIAASALADTFGTIKVWIPNYTSSNYTQVFAEWAIPNNSTNNDQWGVGMMAGMRNTTGAIDEIALGAGDGFVEFSTFTLYGVTGA